MIATALLILVGTGLYFLAGSWGAVLLWGYAMLFALPWAGGFVALYLVFREKMAERDRRGAVAYLLGSGITGAAWLAVMGYFGYRAYLAVPGIAE